MKISFQIKRLFIQCHVSWIYINLFSSHWNGWNKASINQLKDQINVVSNNRNIYNKWLVISYHRLKNCSNPHRLTKTVARNIKESLAADNMVVKASTLNWNLISSNVVNGDLLVLGLIDRASASAQETALSVACLDFGGNYVDLLDNASLLFGGNWLVVRAAPVWVVLLGQKDRWQLIHVKCFHGSQITVRKLFSMKWISRINLKWSWA